VPEPSTTSDHGGTGGERGRAGPNPAPMQSGDRLDRPSSGAPRERWIAGDLHGSRDQPDPNRRRQRNRRAVAENHIALSLPAVRRPSLSVARQHSFPDRPRRAPPAPRAPLRARQQSCRDRPTPVALLGSARRATAPAQPICAARLGCGIVAPLGLDHSSSTGQHMSMVDRPRRPSSPAGAARPLSPVPHQSMSGGSAESRRHPFGIGPAARRPLEAMRAFLVDRGAASDGQSSGGAGVQQPTAVCHSGSRGCRRRPGPRCQADSALGRCAVLTHIADRRSPAAAPWRRRSSVSAPRSR